MSDPHRPNSQADVNTYNEDALEELVWAIEASVGQFKLFLARCNYTSLRSQLIKRLQELTSVDIRLLELQESEKTLYARIQKELDSEQPDALMVFGLESVGDLDQLLTATNQVREEFRKHFHFPLVLWVNDEVFKKLMQLAPDFESWATTTEFIVATHELIDFIRQISKQFFDGNLTLTLEDCREIKQACCELQKRDQELDIELKASIESLLGLTEKANYVNRNLDTALKHYQRGWKLWQQSNNLERQGKLLKDIAFCYYLKALHYQEKNHPYWQSTQYYIQQCLEIFEQAQRPDLVANSILSFGRILRRLQDWDQLQILAQKALQLHQTENRPIELAQDYGFLAEVALAKERWTEAKEFAQKALDVLSVVSSFQSPNSSEVIDELSTISVISDEPSRYQFILAQSQQYLNQTQEAIQNLETARSVGTPEYDTQLYIDILCHLQQLYFDQKDYIKAFEIKLERQSIEQQYGLRAFVGAGRIQPQRRTKLALTQAKSQETIAPEIAASGRQLDVERLIRRIGEPSYKLIVIHGQSGVGKSSLVNGGLVPALKQKVIGTQDVLPVAMRVYTSWVAELGRVFVEALAEREGRGTTCRAPTGLNSEAAILEQLRQSDSRNLRTVLIFDQFEEFFFVYPDSAERRQFFEFLGECLNILSVKVVLSLREDYLHYLLECENLPSLKSIGNDILTQNVRYRLGNFSPADAESIIKRLTERSSFQLESALISQLVQDLAGEFGEVRPIELQIIGAQLQTANITTLAKYQEFGTKEELVKRYLDEVVKDCGAENQQSAELVLYLLTDEKGTRPLKTRAEVERDLQTLAADLTAESSRLDLVLKIFVDSGLVVMLPENPSDRYQLVHDYLAAFIRQQQEPKLNELIAELEKEREQRQKAEAQRQLVQDQLEQTEQAKQILEAKLQQVRNDLAAAEAERNRVNQEVQEAQIKLTEAEAAREEAVAATELELAGVRALRQFEFSQIEALLIAMRAGQWFKEKVKDGCSFQKYSALSPLLALQQILSNIREKNQFQGHQSGVRSVSFSPDGRYLATASSDGTARLWDLQGNQLVLFQGHQDEVRSVSFSSDGKYLATASEDGTARLWDLQGNQLVLFQGHQHKVNSISFSPSGQYLATASSDETARLWDLQGNQLVEFKGHQGRVRSVSFSPNRQYLATASSDETARLWDLQGNQLVEFKGHQGWLWSVTFSPDGQYLATASWDCTVRLWNLQGNQLAQLQGHQGWVSCVSFSPDGKSLSTTSWDGTARLWDLQSKQLAQFQGHQSWVRSVSFSPDGQYLATASKDSTARLWDLQGNQLAEFQGHQYGINSVNFSPDGQSLATASSDYTARVWDLQGNQLAELQGHQNLVWSISFSPDGQYLVTASEDGTARMWDLQGHQLVEFKGHQGWVNSISFSPDGQYLATASADRTVRVWDLEGNQLAQFTGHQGRVWSVSFSPDGQYLATASADCTARLWDLQGSQLAQFQGHQSWVMSASFSPDGQYLATGSTDRTARLWDCRGNQLAEFKGHQDWVNSISFSPDGQYLATASSDHTARLWRIENLDQLLARGCEWLRDYLTTNPNVSEADRHLCDNIKIHE